MYMYVNHIYIFVNISCVINTKNSCVLHLTSRDVSAYLLEPKASLSMMRVSGMVVQWKSVGTVFRLIYIDVLRQMKVKHQNR